MNAPVQIGVNDGAIYGSLLAKPVTQEADALVASLSAKVCERRNYLRAELVAAKEPDPGDHDVI